MKKIFSILLILIFYSCSPNDDKENVVEDAHSDLIGTWAIQGISGNGINNQNEVPLYYSTTPGLNDCLFQSVLILNADKKAEYNHRVILNNECQNNPILFQNIKWSASESLKMTLDYDYNGTHYHHDVDYNFSGGEMLTLEIEGIVKSIWVKK